jgi:hypothetical protein
MFWEAKSLGKCLNMLISFNNIFLALPSCNLKCLEETFDSNKNKTSKDKLQTSKNN